MTVTMRDLQGVEEFNFLINGEHTKLDLTKMTRKQKRTLIKAINKSVKNKELNNLNLITTQRDYLGDTLIKEVPETIRKLL